MPPRSYDLEVRILASLARVLNAPENRERLLEATREEAIALFKQGTAPHRRARAPLASLADL
jgi:hypothetical protein